MISWFNRIVCDIECELNVEHMNEKWWISNECHRTPSCH